MKNFTDKFGALSDWKKIDERFDETIVKQVNDASCVAAVGEMLASFYGLDISQDEILEDIGVWSNAKYLALFLNSKETESGVEWKGGGYSHLIEHIFILMRDVQVWVITERYRNCLL